MRHTVLVGMIALASAGAAWGQPAEQVYKNITQLKGMPADQLMPAMQFMAASLGVECGFCHVPGKFEADDKPAKKTARNMIAMTAAIRQNAGAAGVSCYSCHRGMEHPVNVPPVLETDGTPKPPAASAPAATGTAPTADEILAKYTAAAGGAEAIRRVTSRVMKGTIRAGGGDTPIEFFTKAPNKRVSVSRMGNSDSITAFDGTVGWMGSTGRPAREMTAPEAAAASLDAEFYLPLRLHELYPQLRRGRAETVGGVECEVLTGAANGGRPAVRLYFSKESGLLVRMMRYAETPVGRNPTEIDYADYRETEGVKIPFRWTLSRPNGRFTVQIAEVKSNVAVEDSKFAKPAGEAK